MTCALKQAKLNQKKGNKKLNIHYVVVSIFHTKDYAKSTGLNRKLATF